MATLAANQPEGARWIERALQAFRYVLTSHHTGSRPSTDGASWGCAWISMLGIERSMNGVRHLLPALSSEEQDGLRRMLISEADWLLNPSRGTESGIFAGKWNSSGHNHPESNIWSGSLLWRVAALYPEEANAEAWREQAHRFFINGVSVEADARDSTQRAGRPISERHIGANYFPNYALDHHGYLNVGYMVICLSNAAILHFDLKQAGLQAPETLYHHLEDLWRVVRKMVFDDGRLARIGGDSRVRYAYCQEYFLPALLFAADHFKDAHALPMAGRMLDWMTREAEGGDGTFYGKRLADMRRGNPHYHTRLESDRASVLAMVLNYLPLVEPPEPVQKTFTDSVGGGWMEAEHGAALHRTPDRFASFAWRAHGLTQALCLPPDASDMAEWQQNLCPVVRALGDSQPYPGGHRSLLSYQVEAFDGGFVTCGKVMEGVKVQVDEGVNCTDQATTRIAFAALPDGHTCLGLHYVVTAPDRLVYLSEFKDLHLVIPNDVFNQFGRRLKTEEGEMMLSSPPSEDEVLEFSGRWANIDDRLGLVVLKGEGPLRISRSATRRAGKYHSLFTEELCLRVRTSTTRHDPSSVLTDIGFAVVSNLDASATSRLQGDALAFSEPELRGAWITGVDGRTYALVANFGERTARAEVFGTSTDVPAGTAVVREKDS